MELSKIEIIKLILSGGILSGVIVAMLNYFFSSILKNKETKLKIMDKKIDAYDKVMDLVTLTRTMNIFDSNQVKNFSINFTKYDYPLRYPVILGSIKNFVEYEGNFLNLNNIYERWLNTDITRELNFLQDYIVTLDGLIQNLDDYEFKELGVVIRQDFINISSNLEKLCFNFYSKSVFKLRIENKDKWHKYKKQETKNRFNNTMLVKYMNDIRSLNEKTEQ